MIEASDGLTTQPEELNLRDQLAENLAAVSEPDPVVEKTETPAPAETEAQKADRVRDEAGRFVAKEAIKPNSVQPVLSTDRPPPSRPSSWKKEHWADFDKLAQENPTLAAYLNEREGQYAKGVSTYKQEWENAKPLIDAVAPFQETLQRHGIEAGQWISNLGNAHQRLALGSPQDKLAMFQKLAADYGIPAQLAVQDAQGQWNLLGQQPQPQQQQPDINSIVRQQVQEAISKQATASEISAFAAQTEKYPHFETVKQTMAGLLQAGLADDLTSAYTAALRHPQHADLFDAMQTQQNAQQEAERKAQAQQKVSRARANAISTSTATPNGTATAIGEKGLRDQISENLRAAVGGRV